MKISELLGKGEKTFSFEFFPPKTFSSTIELGINVGQLLKLSPSFISVTYGAGGSSQTLTFDLIDYIQNKIGIPSMAHYTCVNATKEKVAYDLRILRDRKIKNLMLLRGDPPKGTKSFADVDGDFKFASELIGFAAQQGDFSIGAAGYPEGHLESSNLEDDITHLKHKVEQGAQFIVTQMFFVNDHYFDFVERAKKAGITVPIIPGIIPITNYKQIKKFAAMTGVDIPQSLIDTLEPVQEFPDKTYNIGVDFAINQCTELLEAGAPGLHFYTLNRSRATVDIFETVSK